MNQPQLGGTPGLKVWGPRGYDGRAKEGTAQGGEDWAQGGGLMDSRGSEAQGGGECADG